MERQSLVATNLVNLVIVAEGQEVLRVSRIIIRWVEIDEPLSRRPAVLVILILVIGKSLHDQATFCPFRIRVETLDLTEKHGRIVSRIVFQLELSFAVDLFRGECLKRAFTRVSAAACERKSHNQRKRQPCL